MPGNYDGKVVISTELDNSGVEKNAKSMRSQVAKLAAEYRKQGMSMSDAMKKAWTEVDHTSEKYSKRVGNDIKGNIGGSLDEVSGAFGGLQTVIGKLGVAIATAFSVRAIIQFGTESVKAANELSNALIGLQSILEGQGKSFSEAQAFIEEYTKDGLVPATNAITAYKNLAARGYDDSQIRQVMVALKDASAFGRQASYTMGEAVQSATEGLKNENSILVDNAGVTKNVAKMWEEYAESIGTTADKLTQQQKIQAEVNGILEESKYQAGDAEKVAATLSGQLTQLSFNFEQLKVAVGNAISPIVQVFLPAINQAVAELTVFADKVAAVVNALLGTTSSAGDAAGELAAGYDSAADSVENLADATVEAAKAAKKALAPFDEITKLNNSQTETSGISSGTQTTIPGQLGGATGDASASTEITPAMQAAIEAIRSAVDKVKELIAPLQNISFAPALESIKGLGGAFADVGAAILESLEWAWFNLLVPLSQWAIEDLAPATVDTLREAFEALEAAAKPVADAFDDLCEDLEPFGQWIEEKCIESLRQLEDKFVQLKQTFEEKGPEISNIVSGIGDAFAAMWLVVEPILDAMLERSEEVADTNFEWFTDQIGIAIDRLSGWTDFIAGIFTGDWEQAWSGIVQAYDASCAEVDNLWGTLWENISNLASDIWTEIKDFFAPAAAWFDDNVTQPVAEFFAGLWRDISSWASDAWTEIKEFFQPAAEWFGELFDSIEQTVDDAFYNIGVIADGCWSIIELAWAEASGWFKTNVTDPLGQYFSDLWDDFSTKASDAWTATKEVFQKVGQFFKETFEDAWAGILEVFSPVGEIFVDLKDAVLSGFKEIANVLITGLNEAIAKPFEGINTALTSIKGISIAGYQPFADLKAITVPKIPYLAQGAVLPANRPFMAVVGDQKHGTNVEAPLSTIQEAVALVMESQFAGMMRGFEETVAILREILEAVYGIQIGDDVIAQAVERHNRKMNIARGGV